MSERWSPIMAALVSTHGFDCSQRRGGSTPASHRSLRQHGSAVVGRANGGADGRGAVLKASADHARLAYEAAALEGWHTAHTPAVLALDEQLGAPDRRTGLLSPVVGPHNPANHALNR